MSTMKQDDKFKEHMQASLWLEMAVEWIAKNLDPEDVFSQKDLENWAESNGWTI